MIPSLDFKNTSTHSATNISMEAGRDGLLLHLATSAGHFEIVKLVLDRGANIEATDASGDTPLHLAISAGELEIAKLLLEQGADIEATNASGDTPLHLATSAGKFEIAKLLLEQGADIAATNIEGLTPLHAYMFSPYPSPKKDMIQLLCHHGANLDPVERFGDHITHYLECNSPLLERIMIMWICHANIEGYEIQDIDLQRYGTNDWLDWLTLKSRLKKLHENSPEKCLFLFNMFRVSKDTVLAKYLQFSTGKAQIISDIKKKIMYPYSTKKLEKVFNRVLDHHLKGAKYSQEAVNAAFAIKLFNRVLDHHLKGAKHRQEAVNAGVAIMLNQSTPSLELPRKDEKDEPALRKNFPEEIWRHIFDYLSTDQLPKIHKEQNM